MCGRLWLWEFQSAPGFFLPWRRRLNIQGNEWMKRRAVRSELSLVSKEMKVTQCSSQQPRGDNTVLNGNIFAYIGISICLGCFLQSHKKWNIITMLVLITWHVEGKLLGDRRNPATVYNAKICKAIKAILKWDLCSLQYYLMRCLCSCYYQFASTSCTVKLNCCNGKVSQSLKNSIALASILQEE